MINFLPSELIAHIGTFVKDTEDRKNAYLAGKNFSHLLYHYVEHIVSLKPGPKVEYEKLIYVLQKRKPNLRTITFIFENLLYDEIDDIPGTVQLFRQAFPRAKLQAYIANCENPEHIVHALPDDTLITNFRQTSSISHIDIDKLAKKRFKILNISGVGNQSVCLNSKDLLDRVETLIVSNRNGESINLSKLDTSCTTSVILEMSNINYSNEAHVDLYKVTELRTTRIHYLRSFINVARSPTFKKRSRITEIKLHLCNSEVVDILLELFKYLPKSSRISTTVSSPHDIYTLDKITGHGIDVVFWAKATYHHQCAQAINFIIGQARRPYEIVWDSNLTPYYYSTPQDLYNDLVSEEQRQNWGVLKYLRIK